MNATLRIRICSRLRVPGRHGTRTDSAGFTTGSSKKSARNMCVFMTCGTFATLSLKSGVDVRTLSETLGHFSAGVHAQHLRPLDTGDETERGRRDRKHHPKRDLKRETKAAAASLQPPFKRSKYS